MKAYTESIADFLAPQPGLGLEPEGLSRLPPHKQQQHGLRTFTTVLVAHCHAPTSTVEYTSRGRPVRAPSRGVAVGAAATPVKSSAATTKASAATARASSDSATMQKDESASDDENAAYLKNMQDLLSRFWGEQMQEMQVLGIGTEQDFKNHNDLPLARIKRIMKSDEDVRMISAEAPVLFAKACEMFILELTLRSWCYSEKNKRRTLQKEDIQAAIRKTEIFDFLVDVIQ